MLGLAAVTVMEELAFRSYSLWTALRALGFWPAQVLVAVAFSLLHLAYGWPSSTVLLGVFPSGLLFGVAAAVSGGLALPVGLHLGINLGRWATGEGGGAGLWTLDTSALDPARAASVAPYLGAAVPLLLASGSPPAIASTLLPDPPRPEGPHRSCTVSSASSAQPQGTATAWPRSSSGAPRRCRGA